MGEITNFSELMEMDCCNICGESHETESCVTFVTLQIVNDTYTLSRARLTLPKGLSVDDRVDGSTAVIAKNKFAAGVRFGPMKAKTSSTLNPEVNFPLKLFDVAATWDDNSGGVVYTDVFLETDDEDMCNWMCLVSATAATDEQNLFCFQMRKELYYLAIKDINIGDELKVWYAPYYAKRMHSMTVVPLSQSVDPQMSDSLSPVFVDYNVGQDDVCSSYISGGDIYVSRSSDQPSEVHLKPINCPVGSRSSGPVHLKNKFSGSTDQLLKNNRPRVSRGQTRANKVIKATSDSSAQVSYMVCLVPSLLQPDNSAVINMNQPVCNNNDNNCVMNLDGTKVSPLLLGAKQLKSKWKCQICDHTEDNVASYAKHLRLHYKPDEKDAIRSHIKSSLCETCPCGVIIKTKKKLEQHCKVCSKWQTEGKYSLQRNDGKEDGVVSNIISQQHGLLPELLPPGISSSPTVPVVLSDVELNNCDTNGFNNVSLSRHSSSKDNILPLEQGSKMIMDVNVGIDSDFLLTNDYCNGKENDFQSLNFSDALKSIDDRRKDKELKDCFNNNNISVNREPQSNIRNLLRFSISDAGASKLGCDEVVKTSISSVEKVVDVSDCLLNSISSIPPILDLADDEIVVFQGIKNLTKVSNDDHIYLNDNINGDNRRAAAINEKTLATSNNYSNCSSVNDLFHSSSLGSDAFPGGSKQVNYDMERIDKHSADPSDISLLDKSGDLFCNLLNDAVGDAKNNGNFNFDGDRVATMSVIDKYSQEDVNEDQGMNVELNSNPNVSVVEQLQQQFLPEHDGNIFIDSSEISVRFNEMENDDDKISSETKEYVCDICGKRFKKSLYLYRHLRKHTGEFTCTLCMAVFARKENLVNHICSGSKNFVKLLSRKRGRLCSMCGKIFKTRIEFKNHLNQTDQCSLDSLVTSGVDGSTKTTCIYCNKEYDSLTELKMHHEVCLNNLLGSGPTYRSLLCEKCGKVCKNYTSLRLHLSTHGERPFCCPICQKRFTRNVLLNDHMATHQSQPTSQECPICDKKLKTKKSLAAHMKIHTGYKRFKCDQCGMSYHQKVNLMKHLRVHTQKKLRLAPSKSGSTSIVSCGKGDLTSTCDYDAVNVITIAPAANDGIPDSRGGAIMDNTYQCHLCSKIFLEERSLKRHIKKVHDESGNFICQFCNEIFKHKTSLKRHVNNRHPAEKQQVIALSESNQSENIVNSVNNEKHEVDVITKDDPVVPKIMQDHQSFKSVMSTTMNVLPDSSQLAPVYLLETDKEVSCLSKTLTSVDDDVGSNVPSVSDISNIVDKMSCGTDYLYYILTPSSPMPATVNGCDVNIVNTLDE